MLWMIVLIIFLSAPVHIQASTLPSDISGLKLWLKADSGVTTDGTTPAVDSDTVQQWDDQSGNSNNATQSVGGSKPTFKTNIFNGKPTLRFNGSVFMTTASFLDSSFDTSFTFFLVSNKLTTNLKVTTSNQNGVWYTGRTTTFSGNTSNLSDANLATNETVGTKFGVGTFKYDGALKTIGFRTSSTTVIATEAATGNLGLSGALTIGQLSGGGFGFDGDIPEILIYNRALSKTEIDQVENYLMLKYNDSSDNLLPGVVFTGDSMTSGVGSTGGQNYPNQTIDLLGGTSQWIHQNYGAPGGFISYQLTNASTQDDMSYGVLRSYNILSTWVGTNDLYLGTNPNTIYSNILSYLGPRRSLGYKVIIHTILPRYQADISPTFEADRQTLNTLIRNNWQTFADALSDVAADTRIGDSGDENDTTYFVDAIHMTNAGYAIIAENTAQQITALTDSAAPSVSITNPAGNATVSGVINISATATDNVGVVGVQFKNGASNISTEDTTNPYSVSFDTTSVTDGAYSINAVSRDAKGNYATSTITINVLNTVAASTASSNSHGTSASRKVHNLLSMGMYDRAQVIADQYGITISPESVSKTAVSGASQSSYTRTLRQGMVGDDVRQLQIFLNSKGFIVAQKGEGSSGQETNYFGQLTKAALMKFQSAYRKETLDPQGLRNPTGFFGIYTMNLVNDLLK